MISESAELERRLDFKKWDMRNKKIEEFRKNVHLNSENFDDSIKKKQMLHL